MFPLYDDAPRQRIPFIAWLLVIANIWVSWYHYLHLEPRAAQMAFIASFAAVPADITASLTGTGDFVPGLIPIITSMFLHGGLLHLLGNMWFLWVFGDNVEGELGHFRFLVFYLCCGVLATLAHYVSAPTSGIPLVGASGAIAGVMGAYLIQFPRARVRVAVPIPFIWRITVPAFVMLIYWFSIQTLNGLSASSGSGVAWWAHVGGFAVGVLWALKIRLQRRRH